MTRLPPHMRLRRRDYLLSWLRLRRVWRRCRPYTMVGRQRFLDNLRLVEFFSARHDLGHGAVVECGTWRGGSLFGIMQVAPQNVFHAFDSFEGLPPAGEEDGEHANRAWASRSLSFDNNRASHADFMRDLETFRRPNQEVHVHPGWFEATLPPFRPDRPIAVLRLDGDWYASTMCALEHLFPQVMPGGIVIVDDYYSWEGCTRAVHDYLARSRARERLRQSWKAGVAYLIKESSSEAPAHASRGERPGVPPPRATSAGADARGRPRASP